MKCLKMFAHLVSEESLGQRPVDRIPGCDGVKVVESYAIDAAIVSVSIEHDGIGVIELCDQG